jgi:thiol-disulfide isomerase/thioredoxin
MINTEIKSRNDFYNILNYNPNIIIIKLSAKWCGPCLAINSHVHEWFEVMIKNNITCYDIDIDKNTDFVSLLKKNKIIL